MTESTPVRGEIITAIAKAMGAVQKVAKTGRNDHDKYNFASIDDFLALVNPICAENGLIFYMEETGLEDFTRKGKFGESSWMRVTFEITVMHTSGQFLPPVRRSVEVVRNGAQAYGSAQSYVLKQFQRSLFLIPTGDKDDADLQPTQEGIVQKRAPAGASTITADQFTALRDKIEEAGADEEKFAKYLGVDRLHTLPADRFDAAMAALANKIKGNANGAARDA